MANRAIRRPEEFMLNGLLDHEEEENDAHNEEFDFDALVRGALERIMSCVAKTTCILIVFKALLKAVIGPVFPVDLLLDISTWVRGVHLGRAPIGHPCRPHQSKSILEKCFKTVGKDENLEVVVSTARGVVLLKSVLKSLTKEEQAIEAQVDVYVDGLPSEEVCKPMDETSNAEIEIGDVLMGLQKNFAQGLMHQATKIHFGNIKEGNSDAKVVKCILEVLKVADEELRKMKTFTRREQACRSSEIDGDRKLPETCELVEELIDQFIILIAESDSLLNGLLDREEEENHAHNEEFDFDALARGALDRIMSCIAKTTCILIVFKALLKAVIGPVFPVDLLLDISTWFFAILTLLSFVLLHFLL
ncbi:hypothetical protein CRG98_029608 [Punica granatum]|uniref:Uncharacterized protein n=1 Tax=Punica granatum TaxID=22663 RepID=A0A2I0J177_PUNGR|nr:hypothetical protein CRG98_029608 [Punica granatum]